MRKPEMLRTEPGPSLGFRATDVSSLTLVSDGEKSKSGKGGAGRGEHAAPGRPSKDLGFCRGMSMGERWCPESNRGALTGEPRMERRQQTPSLLRAQAEE